MSERDEMAAEIERLREALTEMCDEFEDATYDRRDGSQSIHRKQLITRCRSALTTTTPPGSERK